jgi:hypothetical protein
VIPSMIIMQLLKLGRWTLGKLKRAGLILLGILVVIALSPLLLPVLLLAYFYADALGNLEKDIEMAEFYDFGKEDL